MAVCDGQCVDVETDNDNCGACGAACSGIASCYRGSCADVPAPLATPRSSFALVALADGRLVAIAGWNQTSQATGIALSSVEAYTPSANTWASLTPLPTPRNEHAAASDAGHIYVMGGTAENLSPPLATMDIYNIATSSWSAGAAMSQARLSFCAVTANDGRIYAIGGSNEGYPDGTYTQYASVEAYTPSTNTWAAVAPMPAPRARMGCALGHDGNIYVAGGGPDPFETAMLQAYKPATNTWTTLASMPTSLQRLALVTGANGKIYAIGGLEDLQPSAIVYAYDPSANTWALDSAVSQARWFIGAAVGGDGRTYAVGGFDGTNPFATVDAQTTTDVWIP